VFLLIGSPVLVGLVALVTLKVVDRALAPVEAIRTQVTEITDQGLNKRVPEPGSGDEIDRLAASMNSMLARLEQSSERQRRFVADASHELRSPLASARTTLEVTQRHHDDPAAILASINDALIDHDRLEHLLADLLTLARLDDPSAAAAMTPVDVGALTEEFVAKTADPRLRLTRVGSGANVMGRSTQLERVLTNLTDNALANCNETVEVSVDTTNSEIVIRVDDDGPGIPAADRERVFDRFVRLDEARTSELGTGLGLAIVREIVREHSGNVAIDHSPLGGAGLVVRLPRRVQEISPSS
jgi:signal transduction histidine kinase